MHDEDLQEATREDLDREGVTVILLVPVTGTDPDNAAEEMRLPLRVLREWLKADD